MKRSQRLHYIVYRGCQLDKTGRANILYCEGNTDGTVGGSFFSLLYLTSGLDKKKYRPIVVFHNEHSLLDKYHAAGIQTLVIPAYRPVTIGESVSGVTGRILGPYLRTFQKAVNFTRGLLGRAIFYARLIRELDIDIVHLNNSITRNNDWMLGAALVRRPCMTHERGINTHYPAISRTLSRQLRAIICISTAVRENLQVHGISPENLVTIYNGIDPRAIAPSIPASDVRKNQNIGSESRIIGIIGNIRFWKGQETMIRALPQILKSTPDLVCLLVGDTAHADRPYHEKLIELAERLDVTSNIRFTGYACNVADFINAMEIVVHTSVDPEPFGRVLIEAMAMCKPVVGARGGAVTEIIKEGETGLTFPPGDAEALANAITQLLMRPDTGEAMGARGLARLKSEFDIRTNVMKTEEIYASLLP